MRLHLDTNFLIAWQKSDERSVPLIVEIMSGDHDVSIDPIVETEFLAAAWVDRDKEIVLSSVLAVGRRVGVPPQASRLAATWLARMDAAQRRAHFADALIAAVAHTDQAHLVTRDAILGRLFPITIHEY